MEISPLQNHDGVNAASALENLAHRLVAVHHKKAADNPAGRTVEDVIDIPIFSAGEFGLESSAPQAVPASGVSFLDRIRHFFSG